MRPHPIPYSPTSSPFVLVVPPSAVPHPPSTLRRLLGLVSSPRTRCVPRQIRSLLVEKLSSTPAASRHFEPAVVAGSVVATSVVADMASFDFNTLGQQQEPMGDSTPSPPAYGQNEASSSHSHHHSGNVTIYQTTGPDAHTGPILAPGGSGAPVLNPRSCVTCRRRKVRCDKQMPCSNCRRAFIPCVFPAPGRAPRQQRPKDPNAQPKNSSQREIELTKRLRKLEGIVEELSTQIEVDSNGKAPSSASSPVDASANSSGSIARQFSNSMDSHSGHSPKDTDAISEHSAETARKKMKKPVGRLVRNDHKGSTRYVSSGFWSKLNDEVRLRPTTPLQY